MDFHHNLGQYVHFLHYAVLLALKGCRKSGNTGNRMKKQAPAYRKKERERECVCVCVREREREKVSILSKTTVQHHSAQHPVKATMGTQKFLLSKPWLQQQDGPSQTPQRPDIAVAVPDLRKKACSHHGTHWSKAHSTHP